MTRLGFFQDRYTVLRVLGLIGSEKCSYFWGENLSAEGRIEGWMVLGNCLGGRIESFYG